MQRLRKLLLQMISFLIVAFLIIGNIVFILPFSENATLYGEIVSYNSYSISFKASYNMGPLDGTIHVVLLPISLSSRVDFDTTVKIFYDERYPFSWIYSHWAWRLFVKELTTQLQMRGISAGVIDANQFAEIVRSRLKTIIVVPNGVLPDTVYNGSPYPNNLINQWLISGGILIWVGDTIGYLIGHEGNIISKVNLVNCPTYVMGRDYGIDVGASRINTLTNRKGELASVLGLYYPLVTRGPQLTEIAKYGGLPLGYLYTDEYNRTFVSISMVPVVNGTGYVIIFGDGYDDFDDAIGVVTAASDVAQIIWSEIVFHKRIKNHDEIAFPIYKVYYVSRKGMIIDKFYLNNAFLYGDQDTRFLILIYAKVMLTNRLSLFYKTWIDYQLLSSSNDKD